MNEKDLFTRPSMHPDDDDAARLREALRQRWNQWLVARYSNAEGVRRAWTSGSGECGLRNGEDPQEGTVEMPFPAWDLRDRPWDRPYADLDGAARGGDLFEFLYELQTGFFLDMREFLVGLGVKVPISGSNWKMRVRPNAKSNAQMDFTENHHYWNHAQPWPPRRDREASSRNVPMVSCDPVSDRTLIFTLGMNRVPDKPFMVTEWNFDNPNEYRCEGPIEMAAYGALQDWDAMICYGYYCGWSRPWDKVAELEPLGMEIGTERIYNDPSLVCQFPIAATLFLRGDVQPARYTVDIGYSSTDTFYAQHRQDGDLRQFGFLPYVHQLRHSYFDDVYAEDADVVVSSGLSSHGDYHRAGHAIVMCDNPYADLYNRVSGRQRLLTPLYPDLRYQECPSASVALGDLFQQGGPVSLPLLPGIAVDSLPTGVTPIGVDAKKKLCLGFMDDRHAILPGGFVLGDETVDWFRWLFSAACKRWGLGSPAPAGIVQSDTGELRWDSAEAVLTITTPRTQGAVGFLGGRRLELADVCIDVSTPFCSVMLTSLDDRPIRDATRLFLTTVARSENTGQVRENDRKTVPPNGRGRAPILVEPVEGEVTIMRRSGRRTATVSALDPSGLPKGPQRTAAGDGSLTIPVGAEFRTVYYAIDTGS